MKTFMNVPNLRVIKAHYVPQTETRGARIKLYETGRFNNEKVQSKLFPYDYDIDNVSDQAIDILDRNGFNVVCIGSELNHYYIMCDSWGENYKEVKNLK